MSQQPKGAGSTGIVADELEPAAAEQCQEPRPTGTSERQLEVAINESPAAGDAVELGRRAADYIKFAPVNYPVTVRLPHSTSS